MVNAADVGVEVQNLIVDIGVPFRMRYFNASGAVAVYDDNVVLSKSGSDVWASGIVQFVDGKKSHTDFALLEQGMINPGDIKLYGNGSLVTSGTNLFFKVGVGSPISHEWGMTSAGAVCWELGGVVAYKKLYLRMLPTGSLLGE